MEGHEDYKDVLRVFFGSDVAGNSQLKGNEESSGLSAVRAGGKLMVLP